MRLDGEDTGNGTNTFSVSFFICHRCRVSEVHFSGDHGPWQLHTPPHVQELLSIMCMWHQPQMHVTVFRTVRFFLKSPNNHLGI